MFSCEILKKIEYINDNCELWNHTKMRIDSAKQKAKSQEDFEKKMMTRLMRITHHDKLIYAIAYLKQCKYDSLVEAYESKILLEKLTGEWDD